MYVEVGAGQILAAYLADTAKTRVLEASGDYRRNMRSYEKLVELVEKRDGAGAEKHWRAHMEAALALGMSRRLALRRIVLPQALRVALPGMANDFIALLKDSSLVSVITVVELTKQMTITAVDVRGWLGPGLLCAALYLAMSYPLARLARRLERRLAPAPA